MFGWFFKNKKDKSNVNNNLCKFNQKLGYPILHLKDLPITEAEFEDAATYPVSTHPFQMRSFKELIDGQASKIRRLCLAVPLSEQEVENFLTPIICQVAMYAHRLPASEVDHHSGEGGLFSHSLETAIFSVNTAKSRLFGDIRTPSNLYQNKGRWILACAYAGLLHDIGKATTDMIVTCQHQTWNPELHGSLLTWLESQNAEKYYVQWRHGRTMKDHAIASTALARKLIPNVCYEYLAISGSQDIVLDLHKALSGEYEHSLIGEILKLADMRSAAKDKETQKTMAEKDRRVSSDVVNSVLKAMTSLIKKGAWKVNEPNGHVFLGVEGCFIRWSQLNSLMDELTVLEANNVPHNPEVIAELLLVAGVAVRPSQSKNNNDFYYFVSMLNTNVESDEYVQSSHPILALKLDDPARIFQGMTLPVVAPLQVQTQDQVQEKAPVLVPEPVQEKLLEQKSEDKKSEQCKEETPTSQTGVATPVVEDENKDKNDNENKKETPTVATVSTVLSENIENKNNQENEEKGLTIDDVLENLQKNLGERLDEAKALEQQLNSDILGKQPNEETPTTETETKTNPVKVDVKNIESVSEKAESVPLVKEKEKDVLPTTKSSKKAKTQIAKDLIDSLKSQLMAESGELTSGGVWRNENNELTTNDCQINKALKTAKVSWPIFLATLSKFQENPVLSYRLEDHKFALRNENEVKEKKQDVA